VGEGGGGGIGRELQGSIRALLSPGVALLPYDLPGLPYRRFLDGVVRTDDTLRAMIARKRAQPGGDDVLSALVEARDTEGSALSEDELIGHAGVIFIAGHETTSNALLWTLLLLSQHPAVAADLLDEIRAVLGDDAPGPDHFPHMPLLDAVIRESMRILPAVPVTIRVLGYDTELDGAPVPAGTQLLLSNYHTHRMAEVYADPRRFVPSRWATLRPSAHEYIPFGTGPRVCIGAQFAMTEMKVVLSRVLQRFRLELPASARVDRYLAVALTVRAPLRLRVHRQDREFGKNAVGFSGTVREMMDWPS
jgi:cytochrome P450